MAQDWPLDKTSKHITSEFIPGQQFLSFNKRLFPTPHHALFRPAKSKPKPAERINKMLVKVHLCMLHFGAEVQSSKDYIGNRITCFN